MIIEKKIGAGAHFEESRQYRYALWRIWDLSKPLVMFIGLNPSLATESKNDRTISKVIKIAKHNGFGGLYMMNLFSFITPYPDQLQFCSDPVADNDEWLEKVYDKCQRVVFCWGSFKQAEARAKQVACMFINPMCLAQNKNGSPKHPLYCLDKSILIPFKFNDQHGKQNNA